MFPVERKGDVAIQAFPELRPDTGFKELRSETGFPRKGRDEHRFPGLGRCGYSNEKECPCKDFELHGVC